MITVKIPQSKNELKVDSIVNRDGGAGSGSNWVFLGFGCGFDIYRVLVRADEVDEALDLYADSSAGAWSRLTEEEAAELDKEWDGDASDYGIYHRLGNFGDPHQFDLRIVEENIKPDFFAKDE